MILLLFFLLLLAEFAWYVILFLNLLASREFFGVDFLIFYTAGRVADDAGGRHIYDVSRQLGVQCHVTGERCTLANLLPFNHPPFLMPAIRLLVDGNYLASYLRWFGLLMIFAALSGFVLTQLARGLRAGRMWSVGFAITCVLYYPLFISMLKGQDTAWMILGAAIFVYSFLQRRDFLAGLGLAMVCIRPHIALLLALPFIAARRSVWWGFCTGAGVLVAISLVVVGWGGALDYVELIRSTAQGSDYVINQFAMVNLTGLLVRIFPDAPTSVIQGASWSVYALSLLALVGVWYRDRTRIGLGHLALAMLLGLFVAPHLHFHDLGLMVFPLAIVGLVLDRLRTIRGSCGAVIASSLVLMVTGLTAPQWQYLAVYVTMLVLAWILISRLARKLSFSVEAGSAVFGSERV